MGTFRRAWIVVVLALLASGLVTLSQAPPGAAAGTVIPDDYEFAVGFSGEQSRNQWSYLQWDAATGYTEMHYDTAKAYWQGACEFCIIDETFMHADSRDAVIGWTAPRSGQVAVRGTIDHGSTNPDSDGVRAKIGLRSGGTVTKVWPSTDYQELRPGFMATHVFKVFVNAGDTLLFQLNKWNSTYWDATTWYPRVTYDYEPRFSVDATELVMNPTDFSRIGIPDALDGSLSVVPNGTDLDFYHTAHFGENTAKWHGTLDRPAGQPIYSGRRLTYAPDPNAQWWIENVYKAPDGGLLAFCHIENSPNLPTWWAGGLAYSRDGGNTFEALGYTITVEKLDPSHNDNIGGMPYVVKDGSFYVYFTENGIPSVARAPVAQVLADARNHTVGAWTKYHGGAWTSSGLRGAADGVMQASPANGNDYGSHGDAAYSTFLNRYVLAGNSGGRNRGVFLTFGSEPTAFDTPDWLQTSNRNDKPVLSPYQTIVNADGTDNGVVGQTFYVYSGYYFKWPATSAEVPANFRWLYRQKVTLNAAGFAKDRNDAAAEYTNKQLQHDWRYQQYDGTAFTDLQWNDADQRWHGTSPYTQLTATGVHPDGGRDTVRIWTAPRTGTVTVSAGLGGAVLVAGGSGADGVGLRIRRNSPTGALVQQVFPTAGTYQAVAPGSSYPLAPSTVDVVAGQTLSFHINQSGAGPGGSGGAAFDATNWVPIVTYTGVHRLSYRAYTDFGLVQGGSQWYYLESGGSGYPQMLPAAGYWQGSVEYLRIGPASQHPDGNRDSVRAWRAPRTGKVRITSASGDLVTDNGPNADGAVVKLTKNGVNVWPAAGYQRVGPGSGPGRSVPFPAVDLPVTAGDWLYFHEGKYLTNNYDTLSWDPYITYL